MTPAVSADDDAERASQLLDRLPVGGFVLFHGDRSRTPAVLRELQRRSAFPLLIGSDLERGSGQQLQGGPIFPHAMAFGASGDRAPALVHRAARLTAKDAMAAGVHWLFAPVADVHSNAANPIISTRAFAREPDAAAELVRAFIAGCHEGGALSTAKHFPGHGDTETDSHAGLPRVLKTRAQLEATELVPFQAAIEAGVDTVMTAHVAYPALDPEGLAATWSSPILRTLLRDELGFTGVVVSDSLLMAGAGRETALRAPDLVAAGVDVLLDLEAPELATDTLVSAVENGTLREELLDSAFERVWALKSKLLKRFGDRVFVDPGPAEEAPEVAHRFAQEVADASLISEGTRPPGRVDGTTHVLVLRPHTDYPDPTQASIESIFRDFFPAARLQSLGPEPSGYPELLEAIKPNDRVVAVAVVKPAAWQKFGLLPHQRAFLHDVVARCQTFVCLLGSPDVLDEFKDAEYRICSFSDVAPSVKAAAAHLREYLS